MKIPFDIKYRPQIESGEYKVERRDGKPVRIICWDKKSEKKYGYHIVGLIEFGPEHEESTYYTINGKGRLKDKEPELFIITPDPELTEFEKAVKNMMSPYVKMPDEIHKEKAAKLLELARIQFIEELLASNPRETDLYKLGKAEALEELKKNLADNDIYSVPEWLREVLVMAKENGKKEALKDLPKWRKWGNGACGNGRGIPIAIVKRWLNGYELVDALGIQGEQYIMLSDLEKLPGFKED